jgi:hypothetical protein
MMTQACAAWRGDLGAYIVGALGPQAIARVRRHLETCAACRADYQDLVPVRDWLDRAAPLDRTSDDRVPARPPLEPLPQRRNRVRWRWPATAAVGAAVAAAAIAVLSIHAAPPVYHGYDRASGVHGQAQLRTTPSGTQIGLAVSGLPAGQRCILIAVSPAGTDVAGTWSAYDGAAHVEGTTAIPISQLTALQIVSPAHRLLLSIRV